MTDMPARAPVQDRQPLLYRIPILGRMARETLDGDEDTPFYALATIVSLWIGGFLTIGYPALIFGALGLTALMFVILIYISLG